MATVSRLSIPSFDLLWWINSNAYAVLLIPGGGGGAKTGVKNQIQLAQISPNLDLTFLESYGTDFEDNNSLCSGISCGSIHGFDVICALLNQMCLLLSVSIVPDQKAIRFERKSLFQADFAKEEGGVNCSCFTKNGLLITAGEDHILRVWHILTTTETDWKVFKLLELSNHTDPIMALSLHPSKPWIVSAGKDGKCIIWNINDSLIEELNIDGQIEKTILDGKIAKEIESRFFMIVEVASIVNDRDIGVFQGKKLKMECRGCIFSTDGKFMYSIQSGRRGPTHLIKWNIVEYLKEKGLLSCTPSEIIAVAKVPSTRLKISSNGVYIAVGSSDGSVHLLCTGDGRGSVRTYKMKEYRIHDLPVTGLGFFPHVALSMLPIHTTIDAVLTSCSADNKIAIIKVKKHQKGVSNGGCCLLLLLILMAYIIMFPWLNGYVLSLIEDE